MGVIYKNGIAYGGGSSGGGGTADYFELINKPQINGKTLVGNKTANDLELLGENDSLTPEQITNLINLIDP